MSVTLSLGGSQQVLVNMLSKRADDWLGHIWLVSTESSLLTYTPFDSAALVNVKGGLSNTVVLCQTYTKLKKASELVVKLM
jgi:hypothetical protein